VAAHPLVPGGQGPRFLSLSAPSHAQLGGLIVLTVGRRAARRASRL